MNEHTPGRLEHSSAGHGDAKGNATIDEYFVRRIGDKFAIASDIACPVTGDMSEANARRIAACWNACEGITTVALEAMSRPFGQLLSQDFKTVVDQRDQLVAALSGLVLFVNPAKSNAVALHHAKAVLDSVAGGVQVKHPAVIQRDELLAALEVARDTLDNVQGDINPERGYADELEADVSSAVGTASAAIAKAKGGAQ